MKSSESLDQPTKLRGLILAFLLLRLRPRDYTRLIITVEFIFGFLFLFLGAYVVSESTAMLYQEIEYTSICTLGGTCRLPPIEFVNHVSPPIFVQYKVTNFYQGSFDYSETVPDPGMAGHDPSTSVNCRGFETNSDLGQNRSINDRGLDPHKRASPCGFAAASYFNDTFELESEETGRSYLVSLTDISWPSDANSRFENYNLSSQWMDYRFQPFLNWIRMSPFQGFVKTAGRLDTVLKAGKYVPIVANNWNASAYNATVTLIFAQAAFFGTRNEFLGFALLAGGVLGLVSAFVTATDDLLQKDTKRKFKY